MHSAAVETTLMERMLNFCEQLAGIGEESHAPVAAAELYQVNCHKQNATTLAIYDRVLALVRELKSEARSEAEIATDFERARRDYRRHMSVQPFPSGQPGSAYVRAFQSEYKFQ